MGHGWRLLGPLVAAASGDPRCRRGSCGVDQPPAGAMRGIEPPHGRLSGPETGRLQNGQGNPLPGSWNEIGAAPGGSWGPWRLLRPEIRAAGYSSLVNICSNSARAAAGFIASILSSVIIRAS